MTIRAALAQFGESRDAGQILRTHRLTFDRSKPKVGCVRANGLDVSQGVCATEPTEPTRCGRISRKKEEGESPLAE
jgi:hypothetical protein